jgi:hypothetical protein
MREVRAPAGQGKSSREFGGGGFTGGGSAGIVHAGRRPAPPAAGRDAMTMPQPNLNQAGKRRHWRRRLLFLAGAFILVLIAAYSFVTSSAFITGIALPGVGKALNATLTAESADLRALSSVEIHHLTLTLPGGEPILRADRVKVLFSPRKIALGHIAIQEVLIASPTIRMVRKADGSWNIDPLLAGPKRKPRKSRRKPGAPVALDIHNVALVNATVDLTLEGADGQKDTLHLTGLNLTLDQIVTGRPSRVALALGAKLEHADAGAKAVILAQATMDTRQELLLDAAYFPVSLRGSTKLDLQNAPGLSNRADGATILIDTDLTPSAVAKFHLQLSREGATLAEFNASGPFDVFHQRGRLAMDLTGVDRRLLDLAGGPGGLEFHDAAVSLHQEIDMDGRLGQVRGAGLLRAAQLSVLGGKKNLPTPVLDLTLGYSVDADFSSQSARIEKLALAGSENGVPFLTTLLSQPMTVSWGAGVKAPESASLAISITNFDFAAWRPFAGRLLPKGRLDAALTLASRQGEKTLAGALSARLRDLTARWGTNEITGAEVAARVQGRLENLVEATLEDGRVDVSLAARPAAALSGSGSYNLHSREARASARITADMAAALKSFPVAGIDLAAGSARIDAELTATRTSRDFSARAVLTNLTGQLEGLRLGQAALSADLAGRWRGRTTGLSRFKASLGQSGGEIARLELAGDYNWENKSGQANVSFASSVPRLLEAFPVEALKLGAGSLSFTGVVAATGPVTRVTGSVGLSHLGGEIAGAAIHETELEIGTAASLANRALNLGKFSGSIRQNGRPAGNFEVTGQYGLGNHLGRLNASVTGLDEQIIGPFFTTLFGGWKLLSANVKSKGSARFEAGGNYSIQSEFGLSNFVVRHLKTGKTAPPLRIETLLDADGRGSEWDLRRARVALPPTARAANVLDLRGRLDLTKWDGLAGSLELRAESIDATPLYDFWRAGPANNAPKSRSASSNPGADEPEPDAVLLPFRDVSAGVEIGRLFLHEIAVTNLSVSARARGAKVKVASLRLFMNGAPLEASGSMDFSIPGYEYDAVLHADKLPIAPVMDTFTPEDRGQYQGVVLADASLRGAGFNGARFKHSLAGDLSVVFTNTDLRVIGPKLRIILLPVALVLRIPEILNSPLHGLSGRAHFADGNMQVEEVAVQAEAFAGRVSGVVPFAKSLGASPLLNFPVDFMLYRALAKRADLLPPNTPAGDAFVKLPNFIKLKGTLGNPKSDISEFGLVHILFNSTTGIFTKPAGALLKGAEHFLNGGLSSSRTNAVANPKEPALPAKPKN